MAHSIQELAAIARKARTAFETGAITDEMLVDAYENGRPYYARERCSSANFLLDEFKRFRPKFPNENCEYASVWLGKVVGYGLMLPGYYNGLPHKTWCVGETELGAATIMDITADQFGGPSVYVGPLIMPWVAEATEVLDRLANPRQSTY